MFKLYNLLMSDDTLVFSKKVEDLTDKEKFLVRFCKEKLEYIYIYEYLTGKSIDENINDNRFRFNVLELNGYILIYLEKLKSSNIDTYPREDILTYGKTSIYESNNINIIKNKDNKPVNNMIINDIILNKKVSFIKLYYRIGSLKNDDILKDEKTKYVKTGILINENKNYEATIKKYYFENKTNIVVDTLIFNNYYKDLKINKEKSHTLNIIEFLLDSGYINELFIAECRNQNEMVEELINKEKQFNEYYNDKDLKINLFIHANSIMQKKLGNSIMISNIFTSLTVNKAMCDNLYLSDNNNNNILISSNHNKRLLNLIRYCDLNNETNLLVFENNVRQNKLENNFYSNNKNLYNYLFSEFIISKYFKSFIENIYYNTDNYQFKYYHYKSIVISNFTNNIEKYLENNEDSKQDKIYDLINNYHSNIKNKEKLKIFEKIPGYYSCEDNKYLIFLNFIINCNLNLYIKNSMIKYSKTIKNINSFKSLELNKFLDSIDVNLKFKPYNHQISNIIWMTNIEDKPLILKSNYIMPHLINTTLNQYSNLNVSIHVYLNMGIKLLNLEESKKHSTVISNNILHYESSLNYTNKNDEYKLHLSDKNEIIYLENSSHYDIVENYQPDNIKIMGGILSDEVGLGKTYTTLLFLFSKLKNDRLYCKEKNIGGTLIILHNRLLDQWYSEIEKYFGHLKDNDKINVCKINTITSIKSLYKKSDSLKNYDIVLISSNILSNEKYYDKIIDTSMYKDLDIMNIYWNRIILDEAHEILVTNKIFNDSYLKINNTHINSQLHIVKEKLFNRNIIPFSYNKGIYLYKNSNMIDYTIDYNTFTIKSDKKILHYTLLHKLKSRFRWALTGTPFMYGINNIIPYLYWLSDYRPHFISEVNLDFSLNQYSKFLINRCAVEASINCFNYGFNECDIDRFILNNFRQNTKKELKKNNEIDIPLISEKIIKITQTQLEKDIYNYYKSSVKISELLKLCTNLLISSSFSQDNNNCKDFTKAVEHLKFMNLSDIKDTFIVNVVNDLKKLEFEKKSREDKIEFNKYKIRYLNKLLSYLNNINLDKILEYTNFYIIILNLANNNNDIELKKEFIKNKFDIRSDKLENIFKPCMGLNLNGLINYNLRNNIIKVLNDIICSYYNEKIDILELVSELETNKLYNLYLDTINNKLNGYSKIIPSHALLIYYKILNNFITNSQLAIKTAKDYIQDELINKIKRTSESLETYNSTNYMEERIDDHCLICWNDYDEETNIIVSNCKHFMCEICFIQLKKINGYNFCCPTCRNKIDVNKCFKTNKFKNKLEAQNEEIQENSLTKDKYNAYIEKYGSKMAKMLKHLDELFKDNNKDNNKVIIFSQYREMLFLIKKCLDDYGIKSVDIDGRASVINKKINKFRSDPSINIILLSSDKSNSGCNLVEANYIFIMDILDMEKNIAKQVETQAIGRSARLGQKKPVTVVRFITSDTVEETKYHDIKYNINDLN